MEQGQPGVRHDTAVLETGDVADDLTDEPADLADRSAYPAESSGDLVYQRPEGRQDRADDPPRDLEWPRDGFRNTAPHALEEVEHCESHIPDRLEVLHNGDDGGRKGAGEDDDEQRPVRLDPVEYGDEERFHLGPVLDNQDGGNYRCSSDQEPWVGR